LIPEGISREVEQEIPRTGECQAAIDVIGFNGGVDGISLRRIVCEGRGRTCGGGQPETTHCVAAYYGMAAIRARINGNASAADREL